jgi:hypothetical protein
MNAILYVILSLKRIFLPLRVFVLLTGAFILYWMLIPDLSFDISISKARTYTIGQLTQMRDTDIPRYVIVTDARPVGRDYVATTGRNGKGLHAITFPVYATGELLRSRDSSGQSLVSHLIVVDQSVTKPELDKGNYFTPGQFFLEGEYKGGLGDSDAVGLLRSGGYRLSPDCIVIERDEAPLPIDVCVLYMMIDIILSTVILSSFLRKGTLYSLFSRSLPLELLGATPTDVRGMWKL